MINRFRLAVLTLAFAILGASPARSQELEPRAYSPSPVGTNFVVVAVGSSTGSILFDPTVPVTDVEARISGATIGYGRTFNLFGRQALVTTILPYTWGDVEGNVLEERREITRSGLADFRAKLSVSLLNGEAMTREQFARRQRRTIVGTSLTIVAPSGQYDPAKLINLGTNRWAFKPEVGVSHPAGKWDLDAYAGLWLYTSNDEFYPGAARRTQSPLFAAQGHASYTFRPRLWAAFNATWYTGGSARVNDGPLTTPQNSVRAGGTMSVPLGAGQSLKFAYSDGVTARTGTNFRSFTVAYQYAWFDRSR